MNSFFRDTGSLCVAASVAFLPLQAHVAAQSTSSASQPSTPGEGRLTPSELEELLGSIALYPDPLLANVLAASVYPDEVAEAAKFVASGGKSEQIDGKPWEDPVKAVAKIPDAIKIMGEYPDWTIAVGQAYLIQAKDVMDVVQTLRKKAQTNGALVSSPQQTVVVEQEVIYIKSADPEVIYVPTYSPTVVYVDDDDDEVVAGVVGFGLGVAAGLIIANNMDCNWYGGCVGWGYGHGGYYGGNNDVDINVDRSINTGDINIGNTANVGNTVGNTNTRVSSQNRVGNEGNAWSPNNSKSLASSKPNQTSRVKQGGTNRPSMPGAGSTAGATNRTGGAGTARPTQQPAAKPRVPASRPPASGASQNPSRGGASSDRKPSAFEGGKNTKAASERGNASRGSSRSGGGGGGRSGGGGGGRSGGGRRG